MATYRSSLQGTELPLELIYGIMSWCSPAELVTFSLANKAYGCEAEKYLYRIINLFGSAEKCLMVLSQNPAKAILVESFSLFLSSGKILSKNENDHLCRTLPLMRNLLHLSLRINRNQLDSLPAALSSCNCQLLTLCIPRSLQENIHIPSPVNLRTLAFYDGPDDISMSELALYEDLVKSSPNPNQLLIFHLAQARLDTLIVFPVFYKMSSFISELKELVGNITDMSRIDTCHIFLHDLCDEHAMYDTFSTIATTYPGVKYLAILVRSFNIHIGPEVMSRYLSMLPRLLVLKIRFWEADISSLHSGMYQGKAATIAGVWAAASPALRWVEFPNGQVLVCSCKTQAWDELYSDNE